MSCEKCYGPGIKECISCRYSFVFKESVCVSECPVGYYFNASLDQCDSCHSSCLTCHTSLPSSCLACNNELGIYLINGLCKLINCNIGEYFDQKLITCTFCNLNCLSCFGPLRTECSSCFPGRIYSDSRCLKCEEADPKMITMKTEAGEDVCSEKCGDGYNMGFKSCDDDNRADGDGCDQECRVEEGFICTGGSIISPDKCRDTVKPKYMITLLDAENSFLVIYFDKPVYRGNSNIQLRDIILLSIEGPLNYTFEYTVNDYFITSHISPTLLKIIGNSSLVANYEEPVYEFDPFFNQLRVNLELKCSILGVEEVTYNIYIYIYRNYESVYQIQP